MLPHPRKNLFTLLRFATFAMLPAAIIPSAAHAKTPEIIGQTTVTVGPQTEAITHVVIPKANAALLKLKPAGEWKIEKSQITYTDDRLWSRAPDEKDMHVYMLLNAYSSQEFVHIDGTFVTEKGSGGGAGLTPEFHVTVPAVDIDWTKGGDWVGDESKEDNNWVWINDQTNGSFKVSPPSESVDDMFKWSSQQKKLGMTLTWDASTIDVLTNNVLVKKNSLQIPWGSVKTRDSGEIDMDFKVSRNKNAKGGTRTPITLTSDNGAEDVIYAKTIAVDLELAGVSEEDEESIGGFVPVNADNDNGSVVTHFIPAIRDFDAANYTDDDLVSLQVLVGNAPVSSILRLTKTEAGRDKIKIWRDIGKTQEVQLPATWNPLENKTLFVEGLKEGDALRKITLKLECIDNNNVIAVDTVKLTVTPVLSQLKTKTPEGASINPWYLPIGNEFDLINLPTVFLDAKTLPIKNPNGSIALIQLIKYGNHLADGAGTILSSGSRAKVEHMDSKYHGMALVDVPQNASFPFYQIGDMHSVSSYDTPGLQLAAPQIALNKNDETSWSEIDISFLFDLHAVWVFGSDESRIIYVLGKTEWNARIAGRFYQRDGMWPTFIQTRLNRVFCTDEFSRGNGNIRTQEPSANSQIGDTWILL